MNGSAGLAVAAALSPAAEALQRGRATIHASPKRWGSEHVNTAVGTYGGASTAVAQLIRRAGELTMDEAADIYHARATRLLISGPAADRHALATAKRMAVRTGRLSEYDQARHAAASAWRGALPEVQGPWLVVGSAIANAAGALVLQDVLEPKELVALLGPWRQAIGSTIPVGPGQRSRELVPPLLR